MPATDFDWQADDEQDWDELPPLEDVQEKGPSKRRWRWWLLLLIIAGLLAAGVYWLLDRRADQSDRQAREEVAATHQLLIEAVHAVDYELFRALVSDKDRSWFNDQAQLLSLSLFWGRTALGLEPADELIDGQLDLQIELDPDLQRAVVNQTRSFVVANNGSDSQTVRLERAFLYEQSAEGWQLARLEGPEFWGNWESQEGDIFTLVYPQRDAQTGRRLFPFLDEIVDDYCARPAVNCPEDIELELKLDRREESLFRISEGYSSTWILLRDGRGTLTLPAPSLVGRPLDDAGYQALAQGYASWLGAVLINNFAVINGDEDPAVVSELLAIRDLAEPPWPRAEMPRPAEVASPSTNIVPPHDILLLCSGGSQQQLLRFQTDEGRWVSEWPFKVNRSADGAPPFPGPRLTRLPDYSGALVSFGLGENDQPPYRTYLWRDGQDQLWLEHDAVPYFEGEPFRASVNRPSQVMNGYFLSFEDNRPSAETWTIDIAACEAGSCARMETDGLPQWSPDGRRTLLTVMDPLDQPQLALGDEQGQSFSNLGGGLPIGWLDNETFAYLRGQIYGVVDPAQTGIWQEIVLRQWDANEEQVLIDVDRFKLAIASERSTLPLGIVTAEPYADGWLVAVRELRSQLDSGSYLFFYQPQTDTLDLVMENEMEMIMPPLVLGLGGPYLAVSSLRRNDFLLRLLDVEDGQEVYRSDRYANDWSADRQWLLFLEGPQLRVSSPANDFEWEIPHHLEMCYSAVWVDRN